MRTFTLFNASEHNRFNVRALMTNKAFGDMHPHHDVDEWHKRIQRMREMLGMDDRVPVFAPSVSHTDHIIRIDADVTVSFFERVFHQPQSNVLFTQNACDGIIVGAPRGSFGFFMAPADDPVILLYAVSHAGQEYFAFMHASTQCLRNGIIDYARMLLEQAGCVPRDIDAATLPGIKPCCYGADDEYIEELKQHDLLHTFCDVTIRGKNQGIARCTHGPRTDKIALNLPKAISVLVNNAGIPHAGLRYYDECTSCSDNEYFSHVQGDAQRNGVMIHITRRE